MDKKIRLMLITHDLEIGGLQKVVLNLCCAIDRDQFDVSVLCLRNLGPLAREIEQLGIRVILLTKRRRGTDYFSFLKVAKILKEEKIQVIHTHNTQPLVDGTLGALFSGIRIRIIHTDHARQFPDKKRYMLAEWCMSHFVHRVVGVSEETTANLYKYEKISKRKLITIDNGIDSDRFCISVNRDIKRKELGLPSFGPVVGVVSRLEKIKGITYLLKAMPKILDKQPQTTLLIVGDGGEKKILEQECQDLGIEKNVIFSGTRSDIPEILKVLDVYVLPSLSEGLPIGILEALAAGCPVVATNVGGIPDVIFNDENGILVKPRNTCELIDSVLLILNDKALRKKITKKNEYDYFHKYSAKTMTQKYSKLYIM